MEDETTALGNNELLKMYHEFEARALEKFCRVHLQAADKANEDNASSFQFSAIVNVAMELVTEIKKYPQRYNDVHSDSLMPSLVEDKAFVLSRCTCFGYSCLTRVIQLIGGADGNNLPKLTVTQLLALVAWVEYFRNAIEKAYPDINVGPSKKMYFSEIPLLLAGKCEIIDTERLTKALSWVNYMVWEVQRMSQDEFLLRTRAETDKWITTVYKNKYKIRQTNDGNLVTDLCEDVFSLADIQLRTIRERLTDTSDALHVMAVCLIFSRLRSKQISSRDNFIKDLESCCAAANDFQRMSKRVEDLSQDVINHSNFPDALVSMLQDSCGTLVSVYSSDATFSAKMSHAYIMESIESSNLSKKFFRREWETTLTCNQLALTLTLTLVRLLYLSFVVLCQTSSVI